MLRLCRELIAHRELLGVLILRELSSRYRQSLLGLGWALLQAPALAVMVLLVQHFLGRGQTMDAVGTYARVLPWTFFANAVLFATPSVVRNAALLKKIYFPRQVFVVSAVLTSFVDVLIGGLPLVALMIWAGRAPTLALLWAPLVILLIFLLAFAIGLLTAAAAVYRRDVVFGMPFLMTFWMFLSPVFYPLTGLGSLADHWQRLYMLNPMAGLIESFHRAVALGVAPEASHLLYGAAVTVALLVICNLIFDALEPRFADVV